jgi:Sensors of blue-light using FAD
VNEVVRIAYCSRSRLTGSRAEIESQIRRILSRARLNNRETGLTGALAFNERCFAQVLEGSAEDLEPLFERIRRDPRHRDVRVLARNTISSRMFPQWSMAYASASENLARHPLAHFQFEAALTKGAGPEAKQLLESLRHVVVVGGAGHPFAAVADVH